MSAFDSWPLLQAPNLSHFEEKVLLLREKIAARRAARMILGQKIEEKAREYRDLEIAHQVASAAEDQLIDELERTR